MATITFEYNDGTSLKFSHVISLEHVNKNSRMLFSGEKLFTSSFAMEENLWVKTEDSNIFVSSLGLRAMQIMKD